MDDVWRRFAEDGRRMRESLRRLLGADGEPNLIVPHFAGSLPDGRPHLHLALPLGVSPVVVQRSWPHGGVELHERVHEDDDREKHRIGGYLATRAEEMAEHAPKGVHLFRPTKGSAVEPVRYDAASIGEAFAIAEHLIGGGPQKVVALHEYEDWCGPWALQMFRDPLAGAA